MALDYFRPSNTTLSLGRWIVFFATLILGFAVTGASIQSSDAPSSARTTPNGQSVPAGVFYPMKDGGEKHQSRFFTVGHKILNIEASTGAVTPEMYGVLDAVIDRASARLKNKNLDAKNEEEAEQILKEIDGALTDENFVYPSWGFVDTFAEALTPVELDSSAFKAVLDTYENENRKEHLKARGPGVYYVADCDTLSFVYLAVADALKLPLRFLERSTRADKDPGHNFVLWQFPDGRDVDWETMTGERRERGGAFVLSDGQLTGYVLLIQGDQWRDAGSLARAGQAYRAALARGYDARGMLNEAAWFFATASDPHQRDAAAASQYAKRLCDGSPTPNEIDTCAAAEARSGNFARAVELEQRAIEGTSGIATKARMRERLALYEAKTPYTQARAREQRALDACDDAGDKYGVTAGSRCPEPLYTHHPIE